MDALGAFLGLISLLLLFLSTCFFLYCLIKKNKHKIFALWLILLSLGLMFLAMKVWILAVVLLAISFYKIISDPEAKKILHEQKKAQLSKQIEEQQRAQELQELHEKLHQQEEMHQPEINESSPVYQNQPAPNKTPEKKKAGLFHQGVFCPYCRSLDVQFMSNKRKGFSVGKAVGGAALTGGIGTLAGFTGKKGKKNQWRCNDCGKTFVSKK